MARQRFIRNSTRKHCNKNTFKPVVILTFHDSNLSSEDIIKFGNIGKNPVENCYVEIG